MIQEGLEYSPERREAVSGYTGDDSEFDKAIAEFAMAYADQTEHDWRALREAIKAVRLTAGEHRLPST